MSPCAQSRDDTPRRRTPLGRNGISTKAWFKERVTRGAGLTLPEWMMAPDFFGCGAIMDRCVGAAAKLPESDRQRCVSCSWGEMARIRHERVLSRPGIKRCRRYRA